MEREDIVEGIEKKIKECIPLREKSDIPYSYILTVRWLHKFQT